MSFLSSPWNHLKKFLKSTIPVFLSEEKQYGIAMVASLALVAAADGVLHPGEAQAAMKYILEMEDIKGILKPDECNQIFIEFVDELLMTMEKDPDHFNSTVGYLLQKIPTVANEEWKRNILANATRMAISDGLLHSAEEKMIDKICAVLWESSYNYITPF